LKLNPSSHRAIFLLACLCLSASLFAAALLADRDEALHKSYYDTYAAANALFEEGRFEEPYEVYKWLATIYDDSYILELKMMVCAMNMGMWAEAVDHSRRTLEMYPLLAGDEEFMDGLSYTLRALGETAAAAELDDYFRNVALPQLQEN
jgi:tetratricopeptide (TPR) repeat protein